MGRKAFPHTYKGRVYPTLGWAIGDALLDHPTASDQDLANILDAEPARVQYWRGKAGIPEYRKRAPLHPYQGRSK